MVEQITPTVEEHEAHILEIAERFPVERRSEMLEHYRIHLDIEKYTWELNRTRNAVCEIIQNYITDDEDEIDELAEAMSLQVAELLVLIEGEKESLVSNLEEFSYVDMPEVWAI